MDSLAFLFLNSCFLAMELPFHLSKAKRKTTTLVFNNRKKKKRKEKKSTFFYKQKKLPQQTECAATDNVSPFIGNLQSKKSKF